MHRKDATRRTPYRRTRKKKAEAPKIPKIRPGAHPELKKVFGTVGIPEKTAFTPDPFQMAAVEAVEKGDCLVTAPTGAGKTWIAEQAIARIREKGGRSWYASPLKALSNSKYAEFCEIFGVNNVGILTGDRKEKPRASLIVGTTEILRNQLYDAMSRGEDLAADFVILDEAHFLGDPDRGVVWEEIMIYLPARIPLLMLSATIGNADQIAGWLSEMREKECIVVQETCRPVPLYPIFFHPSGTLLPLLSESDEETQSSPRHPSSRGSRGKASGKLHKKVDAHITDKNPSVLAADRSLPPLGRILEVLKSFHLTPAIFFLKSRADCDHALSLCKTPPPDDDRKQRRSLRIRDLASQSGHIANHRHLWEIENLAAASHHSGQLPAWKLVIESLMTDGLLDVVFATSTVAAGVNFPARTIVFLNSDRFNGKEFLPLSPTEFHQMTGRAGRRGMDKIGFAVAIPGRFMDVRLIARLTSASPSHVLSQIKINFSMVLNLLLSHSPDQIEEILKKSFATYMIVKGKRTRKAQRLIGNEHRLLWQNFLNHFHFLRESGYVTEAGDLTPDGVWASQLRVDQPLMIAEGFRLGVFPDADPALLAAVIASLVNEEESNDRIPKRQIPDALLRTMLHVRKGLRPFAKQMILNGFEPRVLFLRPALTLYAWAMGSEWEDLLAFSEMAEGNLAMLIFRTADNLRHIRALDHVFPKAAATAARVIEQIIRDPVI